MQRIHRTVVTPIFTAFIALAIPASGSRQASPRLDGDHRRRPVYTGFRYSPVALGLVSVTDNTQQVIPC